MSVSATPFGQVARMQRICNAHGFENLVHGMEDVKTAIGGPIG
jgi:hypothetical protein